MFEGVLPYASQLRMDGNEIYRHRKGKISTINFTSQ